MLLLSVYETLAAAVAVAAEAVHEEGGWLGMELLLLQVAATEMEGWALLLKLETEVVTVLLSPF